MINLSIDKEFDVYISGSERYGKYLSASYGCYHNIIENVHKELMM